MASGAMELRVYRDSYATPWGFRIDGGADLARPISVKRVFQGSPAYEAGLERGDVLALIEGHDAARLTYRQAHDVIKAAANALLLRIWRSPATSQPTSYAPTYDRRAPVSPSRSRYVANDTWPSYSAFQAMGYQPGPSQQTTYQTPQAPTQSYTYQAPARSANQPLPAINAPIYGNVGSGGVPYGYGGPGRVGEGGPGAPYGYAASRGGGQNGLGGGAEDSDVAFSKLSVRDRLRNFTAPPPSTPVASTLPRGQANPRVTQQMGAAARNPAYMQPTSRDKVSFGWAPSQEKLERARQMAGGGGGAGSGSDVWSSPSGASGYGYALNRNYSMQELPTSSRYANAPAVGPGYGRSVEEESARGPPAWAGTLKRVSQSTSLGGPRTAAFYQNQNVVVQQPTSAEPRKISSSAQCTPSQQAGGAAPQYGGAVPVRSSSQVQAPAGQVQGQGQGQGRGGQQAQGTPIDSIRNSELYALARYEESEKQRGGVRAQPPPPAAPQQQPFGYPQGNYPNAYSNPQVSGAYPANYTENNAADGTGLTDF